jgi:hypothetical protein
MSLAFQGTYVQINPSNLLFVCCLQWRTIHMSCPRAICIVSVQKILEPSPKPSPVQCPHGHSFTDCACRIIRLAETDCDGPIKRKRFELARAFGHKRRFTMRYPNGDRVGLPMLDIACRSQTDGHPMPRISVQREENAGEACRVLRY